VWHGGGVVCIKGAVVRVVVAPSTETSPESSPEPICIKGAVVVVACVFAAGVVTSIFDIVVEIVTIDPAVAWCVVDVSVTDIVLVALGIGVLCPMALLKRGSTTSSGRKPFDTSY